MDEFNFSEATSSWQSSRCFAMALSKFYKETGLKATISFSFDPDQENQTIVNLYFDQTPNDSQLEILSTLINDSDTLLINYQTINRISNYDNLNQVMFKLQEETKQLSHKTFLG